MLLVWGSPAPQPHVAGQGWPGWAAGRASHPSVDGSSQQSPTCRVANAWGVPKPPQIELDACPAPFCGAASLWMGLWSSIGPPGGWASRGVHHPSWGQILPHSSGAEAAQGDEPGCAEAESETGQAGAVKAIAGAAGGLLLSPRSWIRPWPGWRGGEPLALSSPSPAD